MKKYLFIGLLLLTYQIPGIAHAIDLKIGFVNLERVIHDSAPALRAEKKLEKEFSARDQDIQKMNKQFKDLQAYLEKQNLTINDAERRSKERELANLNLKLQRAQREFREDLNLRQNEERAAFQDKVSKAISEIGEKEKFDLIVQENAAIYVSKRIDITDKVLKALAVEK